MQSSGENAPRGCGCVSQPSLRGASAWLLSKLLLKLMRGIAEAPIWFSVICV